MDEDDIRKSHDLASWERQVNADVEKKLEEIGLPVEEFKKQLYEKNNPMLHHLAGNNFFVYLLAQMQDWLNNDGRFVD
jgi:hypothetical protein